MRVVVRQEQRVAVGRRGLERLGRDLAAGAGAVLDHHRRAQLVLELLAQRAGDRVGACAGRKADQQPDRRALLRPARAPRSRPPRPAARARRRGATGAVRQPSTLNRTSDRLQMIDEENAGRATRVPGLGRAILNERDADRAVLSPAGLNLPRQALDALDRSSFMRQDKLTTKFQEALADAQIARAGQRQRLHRTRPPAGRHAAPGRWPARAAASAPAPTCRACWHAAEAAHQEAAAGAGP